MEREACRGSLRCNTGSRQTMLLRRPCICLLTTCSILPTNLCEVWVADFCFVLHKQYGNKIEAIRIRTWPVTLYTGGGVILRFSYLQSGSGLATHNPSRDEVRSAMPLSTAKTQDINLSLCQAQTELCTWKKRTGFIENLTFWCLIRRPMKAPKTSVKLEVGVFTLRDQSEPSRTDILGLYWAQKPLWPPTASEGVRVIVRTGVCPYPQFWMSSKVPEWNPPGIWGHTCILIQWGTMSFKQNLRFYTCVATC